jgi:hypothetical protein
VNLFLTMMRGGIELTEEVGRRGAELDRKKTPGAATSWA